MTGEAPVDPAGKGQVYVYAEHIKDSREEMTLPKVRAEEFLCRKRLFHGESDAPSFCPGIGRFNGFFR